MSRYEGRSHARRRRARQAVSQAVENKSRRQASKLGNRRQDSLGGKQAARPGSRGPGRQAAGTAVKVEDCRLAYICAGSQALNWKTSQTGGQADSQDGRHAGRQPRMALDVKASMQPKRTAGTQDTVGQDRQPSRQAGEQRRSGQAVRLLGSEGRQCRLRLASWQANSQEGHWGKAG
jgi:hypothetical protein